MFDLEKRIAELATQRTMPPTMPVSVAVWEAKDLFQKCNPDRDAFVALPDFDAEQFDALPIIIEALENQERLWGTMRQQKWMSPARLEAEQFRDYFTATARYLMRKSDGAEEQLDRIDDGSGLEDLSADLGSIAELAAKPEWAERLALDPKLPKDVPAHARKMNERLLEVNDRSEAIEAQARRNQLFWLLDEVVDEVRAAARFLKRDDPQTLATLGSSYEAKKKRRARAKKKEAQPAKPA